MPSNWMREMSHGKCSVQTSDWITYVGHSSYPARYCIHSVPAISIPWKSGGNPSESSQTCSEIFEEHDRLQNIPCKELRGPCWICWWRLALQDHRHLISTYYFQIARGTKSWSCQKQFILTLSSTEAELIVLTHASKEALCILHFITEAFPI